MKEKNILIKLERKLIRIIERGYLKTFLKVQYRGREIVQCGNSYGGFAVDTTILNYINSKRKLVVYSFGIGEDLSFSEAVYKKWNCNIYAFDPTPKAIQYVKQSSLLSCDGFHFYEWGLSDKDEIGEFYLPDSEVYVPESLVGSNNVQEVSGSVFKHDGLQEKSIQVNLKKLGSIMRYLGHEKIDLLKMDIEGAEFTVIDEILESGIVFKELCLEVHNRFFKKGSVKLRRMIEKLNNAGYYIVSVSPNLMEITFIQK